ncbi:MAG: TlpA family protein disulfide reductase [Muribaculaceae bacterium]|nr:TlpA family protein disulfide reductase [Muribaculaceae bacterium]
MKNNWIFVTCLLIASAQSLIASDNVIIKGNVESIPDSTEVILFRQEGRSGMGIAVDTVINGNFCISVPVDSGLALTKLYLSKNGKMSRGRTLYLRPDAKIEINATDPFVQTWSVKSNVPEQDEYDHFISVNKDILDLLQQDNDFTSYIIGMSENKAKSSSELKANESIRDSLSVATMLRDIDMLQQMPVTTVWLDKLEDISRNIRLYDAYSDTLRSRLQNIYQNLNDADKNSRQGVIANAILYPPAKLKVGDIIPDDEFIDIDGNRHSLSELRGKWILLDFWSSGCYSSVMAFPELKMFQDENADKVVVISLSLDNEKMWRYASDNFVRIDVNNWNECKEDMGLYQRFDAYGTPTFVLISPEGEIKAKWMLYAQGSLGHQFQLHSREKGHPEYSEMDGVINIKNPDYDYNDTLGRLDIECIEISENGTKINFFANNMLGIPISISPESYLITDEGTRLKLSGSDGITPGQEFTTDENGTGHFSLIYEALPKETQSITFGEAPGGWFSIKDIRVKNLDKYLVNE